jgi:ssDNA-binding replication factor A large subunit
MSTKLTKPALSKIKDIRPGVHCYTVMCKVISAERETKTNMKGESYEVVTGEVGDETGIARFKFVGDNIEHVKEGANIAIRNGKSVVVNEKIELQIDSFGRITNEKNDIKNVLKTNNISA